MAAFTGWDWLVILVTVISVLFGFWRGLVKTIFALAAWVVAIIGTPLLGGQLVGLVGMQQFPWVVFIVLFIALFVGVRLLGNAIARGLKAAGLRGADRSLGALLGLARALIVLTVAAVIGTQTGLSTTDAWQRAQSRPLLEMLSSLIHIDLHEQIDKVRRI